MSRHGFIIAMLLMVSNAASAGVNSATFFSIPTLDEVGLSALIALVGGVAGWAVRRRVRR